MPRREVRRALTVAAAVINAVSLAGIFGLSVLLDPWLLWLVALPLVLAAAVSLPGFRVAAGVLWVTLALSPWGRRRAATLVLALPLVYAVALLGGSVFHELPCSVTEGERVDEVWRWWPPRTDCERVAAGGAIEVRRGGSSAFFVLLALGLVLASLLALPLRWRVRLPVGAAATLAAFVVLFFAA